MDTPHRLQNTWKRVTAETFTQEALDIFRYQAQHNSIYRHYLEALRVQPDEVRSLDKIPFLPIRFFKDQTIKTGDFLATAIFESSGTTGQIPSRHHVKALDHYHEVCQQGWERTFGPLTNFHFFALLPSYLERKNASLVSMVDHFMQASDSDLGGFFLDNLPELVQRVEAARQRGDRQVVLVGVTFALLDLVEQFPQAWPEVWVMETGGMKGRRKELLREELHDILHQGLQPQRVLSEYGMTELLSQAYTLPDGQWFDPPPWLRIQIRDVNDPFSAMEPGKAGGINVIDLANIDSCAFIETMDVGCIGGKGVFKVMGRFDHAEVRGCNLMVQ